MSVVAKRALAPLLALMLVLGLGACAGSAGSDDALPQEASAAQSYEGFEARPAGEMDEYIEQAVKLGDDRKKQVGEDAEEGELADAATKVFSAANKSYRDGDYATAEHGYAEVLESYGLHLGANVNLALAQLQQKKNDDAIVQAFACVYLYPEDDGCLLNAQAAATACHFGAADIENALSYLVKKADAKFDVSDERKAPYEYNSLWNRIETELRGANAKDREAYDKLSDEVDAMAKEQDGDSDVESLAAYMKMVGIQLGYVDPPAKEEAKEEAKEDEAEEEKKSDEDDKAEEKDAEPTAEKTEANGSEETNADTDKKDEDSGSYTFETADLIIDDTKSLIDDDTCTITLKGLTFGENKPMFVWYEVENKTDKPIYVRPEDDWKVNDQKVKARVGVSDDNKLELEPGGLWLDSVHFADDETDYREGELESFSGSLTVEDADGKFLTGSKLTYSS